MGTTSSSMASRRTRLQLPRKRRVAFAAITGAALGLTLTTTCWTWLLDELGLRYTAYYETDAWPAGDLPYPGHDETVYGLESWLWYQGTNAGPNSKYTLWYESTGFVHLRAPRPGILDQPESPTDCNGVFTLYDRNGRVVSQFSKHMVLREPPWLPGTPNPQGPTAPWLADGISAQQWYRERHESE